MYAREKSLNKPEITFPEVGDIPEKVDFSTQEGADNYQKLAGIKNSATEVEKEVPTTKTRQIADPVADLSYEPANKTQRRNFNGRNYELTPEQAKQWDEAAQKRDRQIWEADNAPAQAHLEQRTSEKGVKYRRWVGNETGQDIPNGTPAPDALRRSLARRRAEVEFTKTINQITGKKSDELRTIQSGTTGAGAGATPSGERGNETPTATSTEVADTGREGSELRTDGAEGRTLGRGTESTDTGSGTSVPETESKTSVPDRVS